MTVTCLQGSSTQLLTPLKEVLESMTSGYEVMKEVVAALQDTERGKTASMTVLLQQAQERLGAKPSREEHERQRLEVRHPVTGIRHAMYNFSMITWLPCVSHARTWHGHLLCMKQLGSRYSCTDRLLCKYLTSVDPTACVCVCAYACHQTLVCSASSKDCMDVYM